ncbi:hypothetical protein ALP64_201908 [Pseudomonas syringae pv. actinidiae]|nr:hypothetical protein ALP64_201908 [Pseudomonas syringae pv. actinidiae]
MLLTQGLNHIQHRLQVFIFDDCRHRCLTRDVQIPRGNRKHRLADELHLVDGQQRVAGQQRADVFQAGNVFVGNRNSYAFKGVAGRGVDTHDARMGAVREARVNVQLIGKLKAIVDVHRFAGHMFVGAVVLDAAADASAQVLLKQGQHVGLGEGGGMLRHSRSPALQWPGSAIR